MTNVTTQPRLLRIGPMMAVLALASLSAGPLTETMARDAATVPKTDKADKPAAKAGGVSLLLFLRTGQPQSINALKNAKAALEGLTAIGTKIIVSGKQDPEKLSAFTKGVSWPVVEDTGYEMFGKHAVRAWPTSIIIQPDGKELARLTGMPQTYVRDLNGYVAFASGKIDRKALDSILASSAVLGDGPLQRARRHLVVAQRLLAKGRIKATQQELELGLKLVPDDARLLLVKARTLLLLNGPKPALAVLGKLDEASALSGRIGLLKGWAFVLSGDWNGAIRVLRTAVSVNPDPSEAYYFLGLAYQARAMPDDAAKAFRKAFEASTSGRQIALPAAGSATSKPTTRPATGKDAAAGDASKKTTP